MNIYLKYINCQLSRKKKIEYCTLEEAVWAGGGGGTSSIFWYPGSAQTNKLDPIGFKVFWKWGVKKI